MAKTPVIKTVNLCKYYQLGKNVVKALDHINLEIFSGEFIIIFGPSGCGKSSLMNLLAGLDTPTTGDIFIRGEKLSLLGAKDLAKYRRTKIGMVFQQFNLINTMNIVENIAMPLAFNREPLARRLKRGEFLLEAMGLGKHLKHTPSELSGGQQQRVAIARSMAANPWIILADEPTGNLDSKSADEILKILALLARKSRRTVLTITHNPDYLKFADRVVYLRDGLIQKIKVNKRIKGVGEESGDWVPNLHALRLEEKPDEKKAVLKKTEVTTTQGSEEDNETD